MTICRARRSKDSDIRTALRARFLKRYSARPDVVVVEELPVCRGTVRVDMAVISGKIEGFEIKSAADNLARLPRQVEFYGEAMDRMTLIVDPRHLDEALAVVPTWWTVFSAAMGTRGAICLRRVHLGRTNPGRTAAGVVALLERDELLGLLCRHGLDRGWRRRYVYELEERLAEMLTMAELSAGVCRQLKVRAYLEQQYDSTAFGRAAFGGAITQLAVADNARDLTGQPA